MGNSSKVIVAGKEFDCDAKVVNWRDSGWDSTAERCILAVKQCPGGITAFSEKAKNRRPNRFYYRPGLGHTKYPDLKAAQAIVRMFTVHHDGCGNAETCFRVLHDERGLSCHFIIDNDGTIYQCLDLALMGFQAGGFNAHSIGVELSNRGDAKKYPGYYGKKKTRGQARTTATVKVHGHVYLAYNFNDTQILAFEELARSLRYALPNLPVEYPQDKPGQQAWGEIANPKKFSGYMGHYHQTIRKWDPGPFDFKKFCERVRGEPCFPVTTKKLEPGRCQKIPDDSEQLVKETNKLYQLNDIARGGFFPVGPWGEKRLWHGGVHLVKKKGDPVAAPFPGNIVAARMGPDSPMGSTNFILMSHSMTVGELSFNFFSLYFHLENATSDEQRPEWMTTSKTWKDDRKGVVQLLAEPIQAGSTIGNVGVAGPPSASGPQLHLSIFADDPIVSQLEKLGISQAGQWTIVDGTTGGRFCDTDAILKLLDADKDGSISSDEVANFFRGNSQRKSLHYFGVLHQSEWHGTVDEWTAALSTARDFQGIKKRDLKRYVEEQVAPGTWWDKKVASHAHIPGDGIVYHFHPVTFIRFVNEKLQETSAEGDGIGKYDVSSAAVTPEGVTDDREDLTGGSFFEAGELESGSDADDFPLEELVKGFPE